MESGLITCPSCGHAFELSEALTARIREHLKTELLEEVSRREARLKALQAQIAERSRAIDAEIEPQLKARRGSLRQCFL